MNDDWKSWLCDAASCQMAGRCMHRGSCEIEDEAAAFDDGDTGEDTNVEDSDAR